MSIELREVRYRYAGASHPALDGVTLTVEPGMVVGICGANESGKSTLCLAVAGIAPAVVGGHLEGSVLLDGIASRQLRPHELAQRCGVLFQNAITQLSNTTATVFEEVAFGPRNLGLPLDEVLARVRWALATVRIEALAPRDPTRLSGGQAQLVALASVLALRPPYLILDEPTSQLDPAGTDLVSGALRDLAAETGTGILIAEHKTDLLASICDRVVVLEAGRVALEGAAEEVLADDRLDALGIEPPAAVRLERSIRSAGLDPSVLHAAVEVRE